MFCVFDIDWGKNFIQSWRQARTLDLATLIEVVELYARKTDLVMRQIVAV